MSVEKQFPTKIGLVARDISESDIKIRKDDGKTQITFAASSEKPVQRWFGEEVLSHKKGAIRLDRAKRGAMPLLFNHNMDDPIGVVDAARIEEGRLVVDVHLFETVRAKEIGTMLDGGLRNVSIGYRYHEVEEDKKANRATVTDWEPYEVSIVTVPADPSVGIGRSLGGEEFEVRMVRSSSTADPAATSGVKQMADGQSAPAGATADPVDPNVQTRALGNGDQPRPGEGTTALSLENDRKRGIENLCTANGIPENIRDLWVTSGISLTKATDEMLRIVQDRGKTNPQSPAKLGLTEQETQRFSIRQAILAVRDGNWSKAGFEAECSREIATKLGKVAEPNKFYVPFEVQKRAIPNPLEALAIAMMKRDLTSASAGAGGYLVETANVGFIELLRNVSVLMKMGAFRLTGLQGNVTIPKQSAAGTAYWLTNEATAITESQQTFVQVAMSPKNVGGYTEISRQLLLQSNPSAEALVMADLAAVVGLGIDLAGLSGSGASGQPTGITQTAGIGSVTGTSLAYDDIVEFQTDTAAGNALFDQSGYVTTPAVAGLLKQRVKFSSTASPIWEGKLLNGEVDGYRAMASNQMAAATMLFGNFATVILAEWGVLEIEVNPFANFPAGIVGVRAIASVDIGVRYPTAFSLASSIT